MEKKAYFHFPGLFEFYELYKIFIPLFFEHREYFHDWCEIGSVYGAPEGCIWGGGREGIGDVPAGEVLALLGEYGISARLTFSNSLLCAEHLRDDKCNGLLREFELAGRKGCANGVIIRSELLLTYIKENYPGLYAVSSTTGVQTDFERFREELGRDDFRFAVPDFRLNVKRNELAALTQSEKDKTEFLCNECCAFGCRDRKACYEEVSRKILGLPNTGFMCRHDEKNEGYLFSKAMTNPGFIGTEAIRNFFMPNGFFNFKIEGRGLGSALILEFLLYYMTRPEYHIHVREKVYLDNMLDLF